MPFHEVALRILGREIQDWGPQCRSVEKPAPSTLHHDPTCPAAVARGLANTILGWHVWVLLRLEVLGAPKTVFSPRSPSATLRNTDSHLQTMERQAGTDDLGVLGAPSYLCLNGHLKRRMWASRADLNSSFLPVTSPPSLQHPLLIMHPILEVDPLSSPDGFRPMTSSYFKTLRLV